MDDLDRLIKKNIEEGVESENVPPRVLQRAKDLMKGGVSCPHCGKAITPFKKPYSQQKLMNALWLVLASGMFALSFVFPHYFIQFSDLTVLFGVKWIFEQKSSKSQILIYKALKEDESEACLKGLHKSPSRL